MAKSKTTGAEGAKVLITAASLAATLTGWAMFSPKNAQTNAAPITAPITSGAPANGGNPTLRTVTAAPSTSSAPVAPAPQPQWPDPVTSTQSSR